MFNGWLFSDSVAVLRPYILDFVGSHWLEVAGSAALFRAEKSLIDRLNPYNYSNTSEHRIGLTPLS